MALNEGVLLEQRRQVLELGSCTAVQIRGGDRHHRAKGSRRVADLVSGSVHELGERRANVLRKRQSPQPTASAGGAFRPNRGRKTAIWKRILGESGGQVCSQRDFPLASDRGTTR
jgi:hypothetical protein